MASVLPAPTPLLSRSSSSSSSFSSSSPSYASSSALRPNHSKRGPGQAVLQCRQQRRWNRRFVLRAELDDPLPAIVPDGSDVASLKLKLLDDMPDVALPMLLLLVHNGQFLHARQLWDEIMNSSFLPTVEMISCLMDAYGRMGRFDEVSRVLHEVTSRDFGFYREAYSSAISCFGNAGQLELMESTIQEMISKGFTVDSRIGNSFIRYYSKFGSITEMEFAYKRLRKTGILIEEEAIRAVASAYIRERKYYHLGEFLRDVGLGRQNMGNLLWNLLLLTYAVNFKMKSLQREFLRMLDAGFSPDLDTFNIRALAFSRMCMFWDLHLSIEHMKHERILPDLVTYGCIVDAYMERKLGRNLSFALKGMNAKTIPIILTDPLVFDAFGKGDFHLCSEALLQSKRQRYWTYSKLIKSAVSGLNRGLAANEEDLRMAESAAKKLESVGGLVDLSCDLDKLQGRWKLIYTSAFSSRSLGGSRPGPPTGRLLPINLGMVFQRIDVLSKDFDNIVELEFGSPWPLPTAEATATLAHKFELIGSSKIKITFVNTTVKPTGNLSQIPPVELPRLPDGLRPPSNTATGSGEFEVTYLDADTRITRGDRGELRVFVIS